MSDQKISDLTAATALGGTEPVPVVQGGATVRSTPAAFKTYVLGKVTLTQPANGSTLTVADGKTLTASNTLTLAGTDSTTMTFPSVSATIPGLAVANLFTTAQTIQPATDVIAVTARRSASNSTANIQEWQAQDNTTLASMSAAGGLTALNLTLQSNISSAAWTTNGIKIKGGSSTLTDTSSSGTVAQAVTNKLGGNTLVANNATTYTEYAALLIDTATASTNVTVTHNYSLITTGAIKVGGALTATNLANGRSLQKFTPLDNQPPASAFATLDTRNSVATLDFDDTTPESAVYVGVIPEAATLTSGIKARIFWAATTATTGNCVWGVSFEKYGTDIDSDSFDTETTATAACSGTSGIVVVTEITATTIDSLVAGDQYRVKVRRVADDGTNDTMSGDAELVAVELRQVA